MSYKVGFSIIIHILFLRVLESAGYLYQNRLFSVGTRPPLLARQIVSIDQPNGDPYNVGLRDTFSALSGI